MGKERGVTKAGGGGNLSSERTPSVLCHTTTSVLKVWTLPLHHQVVPKQAAGSRISLFTSNRDSSTTLFKALCRCVLSFVMLTVVVCVFSSLTGCNSGIDELVTHHRSSNASSKIACSDKQFRSSLIFIYSFI